MSQVYYQTSENEFFQDYEIVRGIKRIEPNENKEIFWHVVNFDDMSKEKILLITTDVFEKADIRIWFVPNDHNGFRIKDNKGIERVLKCPYKFESKDQSFGVLGHGFFPISPVRRSGLLGEVHLDRNENWMDAYKSKSSNGIDLFAVILHELGHVLGLKHTDVKDAVMYPYYSKSKRELRDDDIQGLRYIYADVVTPYEGEELKPIKKCKFSIKSIFKYFKCLFK
jgi:predicted Zn-dependent protease